MNHLVGSTLAWAITVTDSAGAAADPGTGPTATVTLPDGTTSAATVTKTATGAYTATLVATQAGRHRVEWAASGANSSAFPFEQDLDVWESPRLIISLDDARDALNLPSTTRTDDAELTRYIAATTSVIETIVGGPVLAKSVVETHDGDGTTALNLYAYPTAITSVVEDGTTLAASTYAVGTGGVLWRRTGAWSDAYPGNIVVTYTVGSNILPDNVRLAACEELRFLWQIGQTAARPALGTEQAPGGYVPMGYAVPNRVRELLAGHIGAYGPVSMP